MTLTREAKDCSLRAPGGCWSHLAVGEQLEYCGEHLIAIASVKSQGLLDQRAENRLLNSVVDQSLERQCTLVRFGRRDARLSSSQC
jgi:hypothetical protein